VESLLLRSLFFIRTSLTRDRQRIFAMTRIAITALEKAERPLVVGSNPAQPTKKKQRVTGFAHVTLCPFTASCRHCVGILGRHQFMSIHLPPGTACKGPFLAQRLSLVRQPPANRHEHGCGERRTGARKNWLAPWQRTRQNALASRALDCLASLVSTPEDSLRTLRSYPRGLPLVSLRLDLLDASKALV
jgi:hypothetical protein